MTPEQRTRKNEQQRIKRAANRDLYNAKAREAYAANIEHRRTSNRTKTARYRARYPERTREAGLKRFYGLSAADYDALLKAQDGRCKICSSKDPGVRQSVFSVDHNHKTGRIRGLLCRSCNLLLGYAKDDIDRLYSAAAYLRES